MVKACFADLKASLKIDCASCCGLCCTALYCSKTDGFPKNKDAGTPCAHLMPDFRCDVHSKLQAQNLRGCTTYDCFGAGQQATAKYASGVNWKTKPEIAAQQFAVYLALLQLHQTAWYLVQAHALADSATLRAEIEALLLQSRQLSDAPANALLQADLAEHRDIANVLLKKVQQEMTKEAVLGGKKDFFGKNFKRAGLDCANFSMALLIAADLRGCSLDRASFLGADMRDANIQGADLRTSVFLTQMQVNSCKGDAGTKLPEGLLRPAWW